MGLVRIRLDGEAEEIGVVGSQTRVDELVEEAVGRAHQAQIQVARDADARQAQREHDTSLDDHAFAERRQEASEEPLEDAALPQADELSAAEIRAALQLRFERLLEVARGRVPPGRHAAPARTAGGRSSSLKSRRRRPWVIA